MQAADAESGLIGPQCHCMAGGMAAFASQQAGLYLEAAVALIGHWLSTGPGREEDQVGEALHLNLCVLVLGPVHLGQLQHSDRSTNGPVCQAGTDCVPWPMAPDSGSVHMLAVLVTSSMTAKLWAAEAL